MFSNEFDVILFGRGINSMIFALECASQGRRAIIIELKNNVFEEIQEPIYIWDDSLNEYSFLKGARGNKINEIVWKGKERFFKIDVFNCWKMDSLKASTLLKKELDKFNIPIIKTGNIKIEINQNTVVEANRDTYNGKLCILNHDYLLDDNVKTNLKVQSMDIKPLQISNYIENVKGFPITNDVMHINNFIVETPGYDRKYQSKIVSNIIYPIHESGAVISLNWASDGIQSPELKEIYLNELCLRNWRRKRRMITILNQIQDRPIWILNSDEIFSSKNRIMRVEPTYDQLNFNFFGNDIGKSFKLAKIFLKWFNSALFNDKLESRAPDFFEVGEKGSENFYDMYQNTHLTNKLMQFISNLESEKVDDVISEFLHNYLENFEQMNLFLKGMLSQDIINEVLTNLITS